MVATKTSGVGQASQEKSWFWCHKTADDLTLREEISLVLVSTKTAGDGPTSFRNVSFGLHKNVLSTREIGPEVHIVILSELM